MIWNSDRVADHTIIVYGLKRIDNPNYSVVCTLIEDGDTTRVHGLLSNADLGVKGFFSLWKYLKTIVTTKYLYFIVVEKVKNVYMMYLNPEESGKIKTFNGFDAYYFKIRFK